jgi:hypothetical protein
VSWRAIPVVIALAGVLQALDELVRRREPALSVLLSLAGGLLVTLVHGTPFARTCDVHPPFDTEVIAAPGANTAFPGRLFAVPLIPNADTGTGSLARVDVVAAITATHRLENARAIAASGAGNAPVGIRV